MSRQLFRGSAGEYQADEQAGVARLRWRLCKVNRTARFVDFGGVGGKGFVLLLRRDGALLERCERVEDQLSAQNSLQGIFLTQGSNPGLLHLLHWQADSLLLSNQGSLLGLVPKY